MGGTTAGRAKIVRAPTDPLQIRVEGRTEPGAKLGQGGSGGTGKGELLLCYGRSGFLKDAVWRAGGHGGGYCRGMEGFEGGFEGVVGDYTIGEVGFY